MGKLPRAGIAFWLTFSAATAGAEIRATIDVIVDATTPLPGGAGTFRYLTEPAIEDGIVAFQGSNAAVQQGIYAWNSGDLAKVAGAGDSPPGGGATFVGFGLPDVGNGTVYFPAVTAGSSAYSGVYRYEAGVLSTVADGSAPLPGLAQVQPFDFVAAAGNGLLVQQYVTSSAFIVGLAPGAPGPIVSSGDAVPGGGVFVTFGRAATDGADVAFLTGVTRSDSREELWISRAGDLSAIAAPGTALPNGELEQFTWNRVPSFGGGQVAFIAKPVGKQDSLYVWQDGGIRLIVEGTESAGGSGPFENLNSVAVSEDGDLAFVGYSALYVQSGEQRQQVLSTMDFLQGKRVKGIYLGPSGLSSKEVVVKVLLDVLPDEELIVRIPYTVSPAGDGGGGGGTLDPWSMALLLVVATGRRRA